MQGRFYSYSDYFKVHLGGRVQKLSIDAGFSCPNRDGSVGRGGCSFCNNDAFNPSYCETQKSIRQQIEEGKAFHQGRYKRVNAYLAYFQAYSNTYAPLQVLKERFEEALSDPEVIGLVIGTRCDCLDEEKLDYLSQLSKDHYIILEIGIESCYEETLLMIRRGHTFAQAERMICLAAEKGLRVGAHLIFGLPGDTPEKMMRQVDILNALPLHSIKFHQLQIIQGTLLERQYRGEVQDDEVLLAEPYFFELPQYIEFIIDFLERLRPNIIVERIAGEVPPRFQAGPHWGLVRNDQIMNKFKKRLEERDTYQGRLYNK